MHRGDRANSVPTIRGSECFDAMTVELQFLGAAQQVTGSLYLLRAGESNILLECGLVQGSRTDEAKNAEPFPFDVGEIDAVVLSHAHIDHSGRIPLLAKRGYTGPIYAHKATAALCRIMLPDSGYLNEKDAEWENKRRRGTNDPPAEALYTRAEAEASLTQFRGADFGEIVEVAPGVRVTFHDAGHILGSAIVELRAGGRTLIFSGDLGYRDAPVMDPPARLKSADAVLMESTYGDRLHRPFDETIEELGDVFEHARAARGNVLIPAFTVGRTQDLLFLLTEHYEKWNIGDWHIFLDSPMGIEATDVYSRYRDLYGVRLFDDSGEPKLPHLHETAGTEESIAINRIRSGAIIIAGSGMCSGGRILHHLKNNVARPECHIVIIGFQAYGTLGRRLVDGAEDIRLWGDNYAVRAQLHTVGGLSAHADQDDLVNWYSAFDSRPPLYLVHGEPDAQMPLKNRIAAELGAPVTIAERGQTVLL